MQDPTRHSHSFALIGEHGNLFDVFGEDARRVARRFVLETRLQPDLIQSFQKISAGLLVRGK